MTPKNDDKSKTYLWQKKTAESSTNICPVMYSDLRTEPPPEFSSEEYQNELNTDGTGKYYSFFDILDDVVVSSWELEKE